MTRPALCDVDIPAEEYPVWSKAFWLAAFERAVKSAAQGALLAFGANQLDVFDADWVDAGSFALGAAVLSLLMSIGSAGVTKTPGPSLTNAEVIPPTQGEVYGQFPQPEA